jgi:hypothetical protein
MRFKPGDQGVTKYNKPWLMAKYGWKPTFGPSYSEVVTVSKAFVSGRYNLIALVEYPCNSMGPCFWDADYFEKVITDSQLEEELNQIEHHEPANR